MFEKNSESKTTRGKKMKNPSDLEIIASQKNDTGRKERKCGKKQGERVLEYSYLGMRNSQNLYNATNYHK